MRGTPHAHDAMVDVMSSVPSLGYEDVPERLNHSLMTAVCAIATGKFPAFRKTFQLICLHHVQLNWIIRLRRKQVIQRQFLLYGTASMTRG